MQWHNHQLCDHAANLIDGGGCGEDACIKFWERLGRWLWHDLGADFRDFGGDQGSTPGNYCSEIILRSTQTLLSCI